MGNPLKGYPDKKSSANGFATKPMQHPGAKPIPLTDSQLHLLSKPIFPLAAVAGNSDAKLALALLAVDRKLKGVLLASTVSEEASAIALASSSLFPRFVQVPAGITEDRLLGGIELEETLRSGRRHYHKGVLALADGGALWVNDLDRLDTLSASHIAAALDTGVVRVEREGLSLAPGADFVFIGSYDPLSHGNNLLRDRIALLVSTDHLTDVNGRAEIVNRVLQSDAAEEGFIVQYEREQAALVAEIEKARERLSHVDMTSEDLRRLAQASLLLGLEGNRADVFAARAARAHAALRQRNAVIEEDLVVAIRLVLLPRATGLPESVARGEGSNREEGGESRQDDFGGMNQDDGDEMKQREGVAPSGREESRRDNAQYARGAENQRRNDVEDLLINAADAQVSKEILTRRVPGRQTGGKVEGGKRNEQAGDDRGRQVASVSHKSGRSRIAVAATLRAAAPFQILRRPSPPADQPLRQQGLPTRNKVIITADDLRYKRFKRKSGTLFVFAVDASGSMALNRFAQAKGAMIRLLQEAYVQRDQVALVSFRRQSAEVLLAPTRSVELARRVLDAIPSGGATPIGAGLAKSYEIADRALRRGVSQAMILLFTDGKANVSSSPTLASERREVDETIRGELLKIGAALRSRGIQIVVIDTKPKYIRGDAARDLAGWLGAQYSYLPRADEKTILATVKGIASTVSSK